MRIWSFTCLLCKTWHKLTESISLKSIPGFMYSQSKLIIVVDFLSFFLFFLGFIRYNELLSCIIFSSRCSMELSVVLSLGGTLLPTNDNHQSLPLGKRNKLLIILTPMLTWRQCLSPSYLESCNLTVANKLWP